MLEPALGGGGASTWCTKQYTVFGEVTAGLEVLDKVEQVETRTEGIFVMPTQRIQIDSSYGTVLHQSTHRLVAM